MTTCAIVLAAGRSQRMGTQKLLLPLGNKPVIAHVVDQLLASPIAHVFVVIGENGEQIKRALEGRNVRFVTARNTQDMLTTVRFGIRALPKSCGEILVALGDQPGLKSRLIKRMIAASQSSRRGIIVPICGGQKGHPLLFSSRFRREILSGHDNAGLRGLLHAHPDEVVVVKTTASPVLEDMDTPEDYQRHLARFR